MITQPPSPSRSLGWTDALRRIRLEQLSFWRHRQQAFWSFVMPVVLLVLLGETDSHRLYNGVPVINWMVPGLLTFGLVAAIYNNLAVTITTQREAGILKRLRATPLSPRTYIVGQLGSGFVVGACLTAIFLVAAKSLFGISMPLRHAPAFAVTVLLAAGCFSALGLAVTAVIRSAESASPVVTATYLPLALVSGIFYPGQSGPAWLQSVTRALPLRALTEALQACFSHSPGLAFRPVQLAAVAGWALAGAVCAGRYFRWSPTR